MVGVEDEVVGFAVAPRLEDGEAKVGGFGEEEGFGNFSEPLGGELEAAAGASSAEARLAAGEAGAAVFGGLGGAEGEREVGGFFCDFLLDRAREEAGAEKENNRWYSGS
jgi:hypothetical protein